MAHDKDEYRQSTFAYITGLESSPLKHTLLGIIQWNSNFSVAAIKHFYDAMSLFNYDFNDDTQCRNFVMNAGLLIKYDTHIFGDNPIKTELQEQLKHLLDVKNLSTITIIPTASKTSFSFSVR